MNYKSLYMFVWSVSGVLSMIASVNLFIRGHNAVLDPEILYFGGYLFALFAAFSFWAFGRLTGRGKFLDVCTELRHGQPLRLIAVSELSNDTDSRYVDVVAEIKPNVNMYLQVNFTSEQQEQLKTSKEVPLVIGYWYRHTEYGMIEPLQLKKPARRPDAHIIHGK
jgi:hypothetical protein